MVMSEGLMQRRKRPASPMSIENQVSNFIFLPRKTENSGTKNMQNAVMKAILPEVEQQNANCWKFWAIEKTIPRISPAFSELLRWSKPLLTIRTTGMRTRAPSVVLIPVKVNASMDFMPISCATKEEPQTMAVISRSIIPLGVVFRIEVL